MYFKVTNKNAFDFDAKHAGVEYHFPRGRTVACPEAAARHIFGIGDPDKSSYVSRHGWAKPTEPLQPGIDILNRFAFEPIVPKLDVPMATDAHGAAPVVQEPAPATGVADEAPAAGAGALGQPKRLGEMLRPRAAPAGA